MGDLTLNYTHILTSYNDSAPYTHILKNATLATSGPVAV